MQLRRELRNQIAEALQESDFPKETFVIEEDRDGITLLHRPSDSKFTLIPAPDGYQGDWDITGEPHRAAVQQQPGPLVRSWLAEVQKWLDTPDLWSELMGAAGAETVLADDDPNTAFDASEQAEIAQWAADLEQSATERYSLNEEQMKALTGTLRELVEASGRLGRKDWYNAAIGALAGLVLNQVIEAPVVQQVFIGMFSALGHMFGHPIPLLGPGPWI